MSATGTSGWTAVPSGRLHTVLHGPGTSGTAVLICPPFGWEEALSYRARRAWAIELAEAGHTVLRFDLPGAGDSHAVAESDALPAWIDAVTALALELRKGHERVIGLGLGLGGLLAAAALGAGAPLDGLVLWATPARGRSLLRELRAFSLLQERGDEGGQPGDLWVNGYVLREGTVKALEALDVRELALPPVPALLLGRDTLPVDKLLVAALPGEVASGEGWEAMHAVNASVLPRAVMDAVAAWLPTSTSVGTWDPPVAEGPLQTALATPVGGMSAVITPGTGDVCRVYLNSGVTRRSGPSGLWVDAAEDDAANGIAAVRVDLLDLGDSDGAPTWTGGDPAFYEDHLLTQIGYVLDALAAHDLPRRFELIGLCSGAYWGFHLGQTDPRIASLVMMNPAVLVWSDRVTDVRTSQHVTRLLRPGTWRRILTGQANAAHARQVAMALLRRLLSSVRRTSTEAVAQERTAITVGLDALRDRGVTVHLVFSPGEPLERELTGLGVPDAGRWPTLTAHRLDGPPGAHTLGPPVLRSAALALLDQLRPPVDERRSSHG